MWLQHLKFTVGVFTLIFLLTPAIAVLKLILPDPEPESLVDAVVGAIKDLKEEIYFK